MLATETSLVTQAEVECSDGTYLVRVVVSEDQLGLHAERLQDACNWTGQLSAAYVEEITTKTGNYKRFSVFAKMLCAALEGASDSVVVELLTLADLERLKARRTANGAAPTKPSKAVPEGIEQGKRYLILTYAAEFDRVHYPLPLTPDEPNIQQLRSIISSLREELATTRQLQQQPQHVAHGPGGPPRLLQQPSNASAVTAPLPQQHAVGLQKELQRLQRENDELRRRATTGGATVAVDRGARLKDPWRSSQHGNSPSAPSSSRLDHAAPADVAWQLRQVETERDLLSTRLQSVVAEMESERDISRKEVRRKTREVQALREQVARLQQQLAASAAHIQQLALDLDAARRESRAVKIAAAYAAVPRSTTSVYRATPNSSRQASRTGSRIPSPGGQSRTSSKPGSPALSRTSSKGTYAPGKKSYGAPVSRTISRPIAAPSPAPRPRFDPTQYVQERRRQQEQLAAQQREQRRQALRSGSVSPALSRTSSRAGSAAGQQSGGAGAYAMARGGDRAVQSPAASLPGSLPGSRCSSPARYLQPIGNMRPRNAGSVKGGNTPQRALSPGRALNQVKAKLQAYSKEAKEQREPDRDDTPSRALKLAEHNIAEIDTRLHALQDFLRSAKPASGQPGLGL